MWLVVGLCFIGIIEVKWVVFLGLVLLLLLVLSVIDDVLGMFKILCCLVLKLVVCL